MGQDIHGPVRSASPFQAGRRGLANFVEGTTLRSNQGQARRVAAAQFSTVGSPMARAGLATFVSGAMCRANPRMGSAQHLPTHTDTIDLEIHCHNAAVGASKSNCDM